MGGNLGIPIIDEEDIILDEKTIKRIEACLEEVDFDSYRKNILVFVGKKNKFEKAVVCFKNKKEMDKFKKTHKEDIKSEGIKKEKGKFFGCFLIDV